jgi:hypothetical protein
VGRQILYICCIVVSIPSSHLTGKSKGKVISALHEGMMWEWGCSYTQCKLRNYMKVRVNFVPWLPREKVPGTHHIDGSSL